MYKIIFKSNRDAMKDARDWCDNAGISYATSYKDDIYREASIGFLPGATADKIELSCYFVFEYELDAATFCMMFGGRVNYVSGQRDFI